MERERTCAECPHELEVPQRQGLGAAAELLVARVPLDLVRRQHGLLLTELGDELLLLASSVRGGHVRGRRGGRGRGVVRGVVVMQQPRRHLLDVAPAQHGVRVGVPSWQQGGREDVSGGD